MTEETFAWRPFLARWSEEWAGARDGSTAPRPDGETARSTGRSGFAPAGAVAAEFGVGLPRSALTEGRPHTFTTRSRTRPPGPGETYVEVTFGPPAG
ncbi:hypothetical protein [Kitasatospora sp. NPDC059327]|uniref:hypothetical protein n=1 Tax=Kitasatospora sp. NPDC059327 TaxID=3346803 RepID=UPI00369E96EB